MVGGAGSWVAFEAREAAPDGGWLAVGVVTPGAGEAAQQIEGVVVTRDATERGGVDAEFHLAASVVDLERDPLSVTGGGVADEVSAEQSTEGLAGRVAASTLEVVGGKGVGPLGDLVGIIGGKIPRCHAHTVHWCERRRLRA